MNLKHVVITLLLTGMFLSTVIFSGCEKGSASDGASSSTADSSTSSDSSSDTGSETASGITRIVLGTPSLKQVKSDNSETSTILVEVKDSDNAAVSGVDLNFSCSGGYIKELSATTDSSGRARIEFSSGGDAVNQTATITAFSGSISATASVDIVGTTLKLTPGGSGLVIGGRSDTLLVYLADAGDSPIPYGDVAVTTNTAGMVLLTPSSGWATDEEGNLKISVKGVAEGDVTVTATANGTSDSCTYKIGSTAQVFSITDPTEEALSKNINEKVPVKVSVPGAADGDLVIFSTSVGTWDENSDGDWNDAGDLAYIERGVTSEEVEAELLSTTPGTTVVSVIEKNTVGKETVNMDSVRLTFSAPASESAKISLQASASNVAPSNDDVTNTVTLTATVTTSADVVVGGARVKFSLGSVTTTGGGEYISPSLAFTDGFGKATTIFTSGTKSSGGSGVEVLAEVLDGGKPSDTIPIVIGGAAGSVAIGVSTKILSDDTNTYYRYPMAVQVSDSNGNAVKGAVVSLGIWPLRYYQGFFQKSGSDYVPNYVTPAGVINTAGFANEDLNRNLTLDAGEDVGPNAASDGLLTPHNSDAGSVPSSLTTDESGVALFEHVYLKSYAGWVQAEITATVLVDGTETEGRYTKILSWEKSDGEYLNSSPYN